MRKLILGGEVLFGRTAETAELATVVRFLASNDASHITTENLMVDGGDTTV